MRLVKTIKPALESMLCPVHDIHPTIEVCGDEFQIICCCNAFHQQCENEVELMLAEMDETLSMNIV